MERDRIFEMGTSNLRFGPGATHEVGMDLADMDVKRVALFTDRNLADLPPVHKTVEAIRSQNIDILLYDDVRVEPTDESFRAAIAFAESEKPDAFVAVGGGSVIDTAKAANLYYCYPDDFLAYINAPIGMGKPIPGPIKPLIAIPTTAGTGSETTGVAIFDLVDMRAKTGIAHRRLKPTLAIVDPDNTETMPPIVAASTGLDVFCHAIESFTAAPFDMRPRPENPILRPAYQGSNPVSDIWSLRAIELGAEFLPRAVKDPHDEAARSNMALAASMAGMGFGNAGVHLCHGMSYPVSGMVREYIPDGFATKHPIIPHGLSVVLNAPAVFAFTGCACPERHLEVAEIMGADISGVTRPEEEAGPLLAERIVALMKELDLPNGLAAVGYRESDIPELVAGTLPQHRVTKLSPRPAGEAELTELFQNSMTLW